MRRLIRPAALAAAGLTAILTLAACSANDNGSTGSMPGMNSGSMSSGMSSTTAGASAQAGDVRFAQLMIPHHEQAIEMAELALRSSSASAAVKGLAGQIKDAQDPEITTMTGWLRQWGAPTAAAMDHGSDDMGMMSAADMSSLGDAQGADFDRMWLTMMVRHHQGAVEMAQGVLSTTSNPDVQVLARSIVAGQNKEIATMRGMLG
ncbi:MAG TPA: DUF305 domain-containing protein [Dermatophilaceae bacterium]|nr:DUF305 domain-containing protein [Dermatophilaceae bacterium]